jgi:hypothetical protein
MFDSSGDIVDWNILNLMGAEPVAKTCQEIQQNNAVCGKKATFEVGATYGFPLQPPSLKDSGTISVCKILIKFQDFNYVSHDNY